MTIEAVYWAPLYSSTSNIKPPRLSPLAFTVKGAGNICYFLSVIITLNQHVRLTNINYSCNRYQFFLGLLPYNYS